MSLRLPAGRLVQAARAAPLRPSLHLQYLLPQTQVRHRSWLPWRRSTSEGTNAFDKAVEQKTAEKEVMARINNRTQGGSIFNEEMENPEATASPDDAAASAAMAFSTAKEHTMRALDPDPRWRVRYLKRQVWKMVRADFKPTKEEMLKRTERELTSKSPLLPTSSKKLVMLARQVAGKTVDDAITQMQFSKKKMAREVLWQLKEARDLAVAGRGMNMGKHNGEAFDKPHKIQTKDGKWVEVTDPTALYVDQAWVGKGEPRGYRIRYHGRSRQSIMWKPTTSISLVLKEEKTRIRLHNEREAKKKAAKPWVHLPNRPVSGQRQHYSW